MNEVLNNLIKLFSLISIKRKYQLFLVFIFTVSCSFLEALSLSSIIPLLNLFSNPNGITSNEFKLFELLNYLGINNFNIFAKIFIFLILASTLSRIFLIWISNYISQSIFMDLSIKVYENTLHYSYLKFKKLDTSEVISNILIKSSTVQSSISSIVNIFISLIMISIISSTILFVELELTLYLATFLTVFYFTLSFYTSKLLKENGKILARHSPLQHQIISSSIYSYKQSKINKFQKKYVGLFFNSLNIVRKIFVQNIFLSQSPRYILEGLIILLITFYLLMIYDNQNSAFTKISLIAFIVASGQRLLPIMNALYSNYLSLNSNHHSLNDVLDSIKINVDNNNNKKILPFNEKIEISNISFKYPNEEKYILKNFSVTINKGEKIAIIGESGCGKTTFTDLLMGLVNPNNGTIKSDGINIKDNIDGWQKNINCISQNPYLINDTVERNIKLFNHVSKKDFDKIVSIFQLQDIINLKSVGDNGSLISGGQKQRVSLARAFALNKNLLILDESTNAIDLSAEKKIIKKLFSFYKNTTILIIAHRKETINLCERVIKIK